MSYRSCTVYSIITTNDSVVVINLTNDADSSSMTEAFIKLLKDKAPEN